MSPNETRSIRQEETVLLWRKKGAHGFFVAAPGFGKTQVGILAGRSSGLKVLVIVPTEDLQKQWQERYPEARVEIINTFSEKLYLLDWSEYLLIADECHKYAGETAKKFPRVLDTLAKERLFLSATLEFTHELKLRNADLVKVDEVPISECIEKGWIAPINEYNLLIPFGPAEQETYDALFQKQYAMSTMFESTSQAQAVLVLYRERKAGIIKNPNLSDPDGTMVGMAAQFVRNASKMDGLCRSSEAKFAPTIAILEQLIKIHIKTIVFTKTIADCMRIEKMLLDLNYSAVTYHSKLRKSEKDTARSRIKCGDYDVIINPQSLEQGTDIPDLGAAVLFAGDSKVLQQVQRKGRSARTTKDISKESIVINLAIKGSHEERWVRLRQRGSYVLQVSSVEELPIGRSLFPLTKSEKKIEPITKPPIIRFGQNNFS